MMVLFSTWLCCQNFNPRSVLKPLNYCYISKSTNFTIQELFHMPSFILSITKTKVILFQCYRKCKHFNSRNTISDFLLTPMLSR